jgi:hypothetical protein
MNPSVEGLGDFWYGYRMFNKGVVLCSLVTLIVLVTPFIALADTSTTTDATSIDSIASTTPAIDPHNSVDVEAYLQNYFADAPVMVNIAKCESDFTQFNTDGSVLDGGSGGMIGVFQINAAVHTNLALSLSDDITTLPGNAAYARYLYRLDGTQPWDSSESCWGSMPVALAGTSSMPMIVATSTSASVVAPTVTSSPTLISNLKVGSTGPQVLALEKILNADGFIITKKGAGSPGQETDSFGTLTQKALERFQCVQNIACSGTGATTGYGVAGAKTRAALLSAASTLAINK